MEELIRHRQAARSGPRHELDERGDIDICRDGQVPLKRVMHIQCSLIYLPDLACKRICRMPHPRCSCHGVAQRRRVRNPFQPVSPLFYCFNSLLPWLIRGHHVYFVARPHLPLSPSPRLPFSASPRHNQACGRPRPIHVGRIVSQSDAVQIAGIGRWRRSVADRCGHRVASCCSGVPLQATGDRQPATVNRPLATDHWPLLGGEATDGRVGEKYPARHRRRPFL